jgi:protein-disulfide isomerase
MKNKMKRLSLLVALFYAAAFGQNAPSRPGTAKDTTDTKSAAPVKLMKAGAVTMPIPKGMTRDQADAMLTELRQIRQLLEKQQTVATAPAPAAPTDKVAMKVGDGWYAIGRDDAPVTLVEFSDYQCPFCRKFQTDGFVQLKKNYIDTGKVRFVSRDLPLDFHDNAPRAAEAARCAGDQGKYWEMRNQLVTNSDLSTGAILRYAQSLSMDSSIFEVCISSEKHKAEIEKDLSDAAALQISGTPTFVLAKTTKDTLTGVRMIGVQPYSTFDSAIRQLLGAAQ